MMKDKQAEYQEFDDFQESPCRKKKKRNLFKEIIDGTIISNDFFVAQLKLILLLTVLGIFYIGNSYHADKLVRRGKKLEIELKKLQPEAISISSELMQQSNQSEVARLLLEKKLELIESREAPVKIVVNRSQFE